MSKLIATFFYVGYLRPASGTWGSAAAIPVAYGIHLLGGPIALGLATTIAFFSGLWATDHIIAGQEDHDPSEVVLDEVAGQWIALLPVSYGAWSHDISMVSLWPGILAAFLFFRLFDIWKPGPAGKADARGDAMGVMLDDIWAGLFAAIAVIGLGGAYHTIF
jgi:phosphatidylglycerophosphatase A